MMTFYHGSPRLFNQFDLRRVGDGKGLKFGYGVYLSESIPTAVLYSQCGNKETLFKDHYLYTVEFLPELAEGNYLISAKPVHPDIVKRAETKLGQPIPKKLTLQGKEFRKWIGLTLTGLQERCLESEKAAAEFLDSIGVVCNIWPKAQVKADLYNTWRDIPEKNLAVFNDKYVRIVKIEHFEGQFTKDSFVEIAGTRKEISDLHI